MKIKLILVLILFNFRAVSQKNTQIEQENPLKLQHFCSGITFGYEGGFKTPSSKLYIGYNSTLCSKEEKYALLIDNFFVYNTAFKKWNFNNTLTYRINYALGIAYSSDIYVQNKKISYAYGLGITYEIGSYISVGGYYHPSISKINQSNFSVRLVLRPVNFFNMQSNVGSHWKSKK